MKNNKIKENRYKTRDFTDFPGGAHGRYLMHDLNTLLNLFARGDEGRDMSFEQLTSSPSSAVMPRLDKSIEKNRTNNKEGIMKLLEFVIAQPASTAVEGDFNKNQPNLSRQQVDSTDEPQYIEAGVPAWLVNALSGVGFGKLASKLKFPYGYGFPTNLLPKSKNAHSAIDNLIDANKLSTIAKKPVEVSNMIPNQLAKIRANTQPNPDITKIILRNDPGRKRMLENLKKNK